MKNKNGSISVGVMVIVTLLLFVFILVSLNVNASKISENFKIVPQLGEVYSEQQGYENTLHFRLLEVFLNSYQKVLSENFLKIGKESLNEQFRLDVETNFKNVESGTNSKLKSLFSSVAPLVFNGETIYVSKPYSTEKELSLEKEKDSKVIYNSQLNSSVSFGMLELPSFDSINRNYLECSVLSEKILIESCFKKAFSGFNVAISYVPISSSGAVVDLYLLGLAEEPVGLSYKKEVVTIKLTSKDKYYLNHEMKNIEFSFSFDYIPKK